MSLTETGNRSFDNVSDNNKVNCENKEGVR